MSQTFEELEKKYPSIRATYALKAETWDALSPSGQRDWALLRLAAMVEEREANWHYPDVLKLIDQLENRVTKIVNSVKQARGLENNAFGSCSHKLPIVGAGELVYYGDCGEIGIVLIGGKSYCGAHAASATIDPDVR